MRIPLARHFYQLKSKPISAQRCVNLYYEPAGEETKTQGALYSTPGLTTFAMVGTGPIWGMHKLSELLYVVSGDNVFTVDQFGGANDLGTIGTVSDVVIMADNGTDVTIVKEDGAAYNARPTSLTQITDPDFPSVSSVTVLNFYGIFSKKDTTQFIISNLNDMSAYTATDIASAEEKPDLIVRVFAFAGELWLFGEETIEVWDGVAQGDFPFLARRSASMQRGCAAKRSVAQEDNTIFWLGEDRTVYRANGYSPQRISTHAIEQELQTYTTVDDAEAFIYTQDGHKFLVLTFPTESRTWVYDIATGLWHERRSFEEGRWRATSHTFIYDKNLVGDFELGIIYELDLNKFTDNGVTIERINTLPSVYENDNRITHASLKVDFESGTGTVSGQGENPQVALRYSDDGGQTFASRGLFRNIGKIGEFLTRAVWRRLGRPRQRVYELKITDPVKVVIAAAFINEPD